MNVVTIYIDNKPYKVRDGQNLLNACLSLGLDIPYFCWHPAMHSVGACRQCAVKEFRDEKDTRGRIVMSCMTGVREGMRISIEDAEAKSFRRSIIELLMLNHPHDCPVCDEGGECHLQDMTQMTGHIYRRSRFKKRTHVNQYLGPFLTHEMNRCIQCYRCVRYYRDYAGGRDFDVFAAHDSVYFGRQRDGVLENEFSGNLVEICPTGVFTDKTLQKHYSRKWDLQTAPSVCVHCGTGCNTIPGERYGELRRIRARYNGEVNRYFLCDRGRYGYEFVNGDRRIRQPLLAPPGPGQRGQRAPEPANRDGALGRIRDIMMSSKGMIGIGSPRASLEANFALRTLVGPQNFYNGMSRTDSELAVLIAGILKKGPARSPSLRDVESCDAVLVLGEDVTNTAPLLALSLRQAARSRSFGIAGKMRVPFWDDAAVRNATQGVKGVFSVAAPYRTKLDELAVQVFHGTPDDIARFGFAVAAMLNPRLATVNGLDETSRSLAAAVAENLKNAKRPLIVSGTGCRTAAVIQAAANIAWSLCGTDRTSYLSLVVPACNTLGLALMGGGNIERAFETARQGTADTVIVLENDLHRAADDQTVRAFYESLKHLIVIDHTGSRTVSHADVALPAGTFAESDGTFVNSEGRAQRFYQVFMPGGDIQESWRWLRDIMTAAGHAAGRDWEGLDAVIAAMATAIPVFSAVPDIAPPSGFRIAGMKIPRKPHRYSGRTAMDAGKTVFEPKPPRDPDSPLAFTMEGFPGRPPSPLIARFWAPKWNSPQAINKFQAEVGGSLQGGDPGRRLIEPGTGGEISFFTTVPGAFARRADEWLFVPAHHIFGSEELSAAAPGVAELAPRPYIGVNLRQPGHPDLTEGQQVTATAGIIQVTAPVRHVHGLSAGVAALPIGVLGESIPELPVRGKLTTAGQGS